MTEQTSSAEVLAKLSAMKADGSSTRARINAAGNGPYGVFQEFLVEAYESRPAKTKKEWKKLVAEAKKQTVDTLVVKKGAAKVGAKDIANAIYLNDQSDAYKELVNMVPISLDDLREIMGRARGYVANENAAYVQKYGSQAQGFSTTEAEATEAEATEVEEEKYQAHPEPYPVGYGEELPREFVETEKARQTRVKREKKKAEKAQQAAEEKPSGSKNVLGAKKEPFKVGRKGKKVSLVLPRHLRKREQMLKAVREQWETMQNNYGLVPGSQSEAARLEADRIGRELFELETNIDLSNVSDADVTVMASILEGASKGFQNLVLSSKKREYLGAHAGGWKALLRNVKPTDELDEIAKEHDMAFLLASAEKNVNIRKDMIKRADQDMIRQIDKLLASINVSGANVQQSHESLDLISDANRAKSALTAKMKMDDYGLSPSDWMTSGVRTLDPALAIKKSQQLTRDFTDYIDHAEKEAKQYEEAGKRYPIVFPAGYVEQFKRIAAESSKFEPVYEEVKYEGPLPTFEQEEKEEAPPSSARLPPPVEILPGETQIVQQDPSRIKKVAMGLEDILSDLQKMNRPPAIGSESAAQDIFSLKPVTGERNMRPLLVKGDVAGIVKRKEDEETENMNFYANWKFVSSGWGNGNQQALPDQIGMPFKNQLLRAQWRNQDYMFSDNFDVGARDWYRQTYLPHRRRDEIIHSKRIAHMYGVPMIRDTQTHQLPTRNGSLPAGVGRPIHFAEETANGWDIYTPNQRLNARSTRLFNGDVVDGRRV